MIEFIGNKISLLKLLRLTSRYPQMNKIVLKIHFFKIVIRKKNLIIVFIYFRYFKNHSFF